MTDGDTKGLQRPGLAGVVEALTNTSPGHHMLWSGMGAWSISGKGSRYDKDVPGRLGVAVSNPWITTDPREALEILQTRDLAPEGDVRRAFACSKCNGRGHMLGGDPYEGDGTGSPWACPVCKGKAARGEYPLSIPDIVAWASLGIPAIMRAEELARETVARLREYGAPQPERVAWRVGERRPADAAAWRDSGIGTLSRRGVLIIHAPARCGPIGPPCDLWDMGLAIWSITADAVTLVVPNVGAT